MNQGTGRNAPDWLVSVVMVSYFYTQPRTTPPNQAGTVHSGLSLPPSINNQENAEDMPNLTEASPQRGSIFPSIFS